MARQEQADSKLLSNKYIAHIQDRDLMINFKQFAEAKLISESKDLDQDFLRRAAQIKSFNLSLKDFQTTKYKEEIRHLFKTYILNNVDFEKTANKFDKDNLNSLISNLKTASNKDFIYLYKYNLKGVGPGEVMFFLLIDEATIGGGLSKGDIIIGSKTYEVKSVNVSKTGHANTFRLGGRVALADLHSKIKTAMKQYDITKSVNEISRNHFRALEKADKKLFDEVNKEYAQSAYNQYFKHHTVVFVKNSTKAIGEIVSIQDVKIEDITIDVITSGQIRPFVKLR